MPSDLRCGFVCFLLWMLLIVTAASGSVLAASPDEKIEPRLPPANSQVPDPYEKLEPLDRSNDFKSRAKILSDLYEQLEAAGDAETANAIAQAIEKIWGTSGSDTVDLLMNRAVKLVHGQNLETALKILDAVVQLAPNYPEGWHKRAMIHFMKRDYALSMQDIRQVLALDHRHFKAIHGLGLILKELGNNEAALKAFRQVLKIYPFMETARQSEKELSRQVEGQGI